VIVNDTSVGRWSEADAGDAGPVSTAEEIIELARRCEYLRPEIRALMARLPESDEELDAALETLIRARERNAFRNLWVASLAAERSVDARHVLNGVNVAGSAAEVFFGWRWFRGDLAGVLVECIRTKMVHFGSQAVLLACALRWWEEHGDGPKPPGFVSIARTLARISPKKWKETDLFDFGAFCAASVSIDDQGMRELLDRTGVSPVDTLKGEKIKAALDELMDHPVIELVPETRKERVLSGYTVKRAVEKRGRNGACPCGSGKKYKRCCVAKDNERLLESSPVAGLTLNELHSAPEPHLTEALIEGMSNCDLYRLDTSKVDRSLLPAIIGRLVSARELERAEEILSGTSEPDEELRLHFANFVTLFGMHGRCDLVRSSLNHHEWLREEEYLCHLVAAEEDGSRLLEMLETAARVAIEDKPEELRNELLALSLLWSGRLPALSLLLARGVIANPASDPRIVESIMTSARKLLDQERWNPLDVIEEFYERAKPETQERKRSEDAVARVKSESQEELRIKGMEMQRLREELKQAQAALDARQLQEEEEEEIALSAPTVPAVSTPPAPSPEMKLLRDRCERLREELKERHCERNELRRDLEATRGMLDSLLGSKKTGEDSGLPHPGVLAALGNRQEDDEEGILQAQTELANWPQRFPVWPEGVRERRKIPDEVWRAAVVLSGRLAAGDPGAIHGVRLLKGLKGVHRQRFAGSWRLLFEVNRTELRLLDVVNRRDLVAWAKARE